MFVTGPSRADSHGISVNNGLGVGGAVDGAGSGGGSVLKIVSNLRLHSALCLLCPSMHPEQPFVKPCFICLAHVMYACRSGTGLSTVGKESMSTSYGRTPDTSDRSKARCLLSCSGSVMFFKAFFAAFANGNSR